MKRTKIEMPVGQPGRQRSKAKKAKAPLSARLRRRAEERLRRQRRAGKPGAGRQRAGAGIERLVHELRAHQIELEVQNEELRQTQHELGVSREKYFDLYDLAPVGYLTLNEPGRILEANLTATRLLGVARKDLLRQPLTRFILPEDLGIFHQHRQRLFASRAPQTCELRLTRPGGAPLWVRGEAILAQDHKTGAPVCRMTLSDLTQRKQADETLTRQLEILNATPDFIGFADARDTRILYINPAGRKMIGWGAEEDVTRLKMAEVHPAWTNQLFREEILPIAIRDGVWKGDAAFLRRDGREIPVTMVLLAHKSPGGEVERFSTISRDITERKQAEADRERLAQFERLAQLMKCANDSILLADEHGRILEANDRALETYGYSLAELRQKTIEDLRTPESRAELPHQIEQLETDGWAVFETMNQRRDGAAFPVEISARFIEIAGVRHRLGIVRDITRRKRAEEALRYSETRFRELFSHMSSGVAVYEARNDGQDFVFKDFNRAAERIEATPREAVLGRSVLEVFPGVKEFGLLNVLQRVWRTGQPEHPPPGLYRDKHLAGWRENHVYKLPSGEIVAVYDDVTERKLADAALRESEARFRAIASHTPDHILIQDCDLRYHLVINPQLGLTEADMIGKTDRDILGKEDAEKLTAIKRKVLETGEPVQLETSLQNSKGETEFFEGAYIPKFDATGKADGLVGYVRNVTECKRADALLRIEHVLALALSKSSRLKEGLRLCLEAALNISGMECGGFYLVDKTSGALDLVLHKGLSSDFVKAAAHYAADSAHAKLVMAGEPVYAKHPALGVPLSEAERRESLRAIAVVPVSHEGQVIGCLNVASQALGEVPAFARDTLETVAVQTGNAIARLRAEEALQRQTEVQQTIFDNIPVMIAFFDREGRPQLVNRCWQSTLGWSLEEARHKDILAEFYPDLAYRKHVRDYIADNAGTWADFKTRIRDGRMVDTSWVNVSLADGFSIGIGIDITERKRTEKKMQMFSQEIIAAREDERKRVSSVLHHDVGSLTVGISSHFDAIEQDLRSGKPGEALQWMKRTRKLFGESVARLKKLAIGLRPPELDVLGLRAALRQYFSQVTERGGTRIHFRETLGRTRVPGDTATILFRVAQEALTNAITHGHATRVEVALSASKEEVGLTVRNNGKAFDPSEHRARAASHMGLRVMREMAASVGGTFTIDSGRGKRTTVRMRLPIADCGLRIAD